MALVYDSQRLNVLLLLSVCRVTFVNQSKDPLHNAFYRTGLQWMKILPLLNQPSSEHQFGMVQHLYSIGSEHVLLDYSQHLFGIYLLPLRKKKKKKNPNKMTSIISAD